MCNDVLRNVSSELQKEASSHLDFSVYTFFLSSHSVTLYKTQDEYEADLFSKCWHLNVHYRYTLHLSQESLRISYTVSFPLHCKQSPHLCQRSVSYIWSVTISGIGCTCRNTVEPTTMCQKWWHCVFLLWTHIMIPSRSTTRPYVHKSIRKATHSGLSIEQEVVAWVAQYQW